MTCRTVTRLLQSATLLATIVACQNAPAGALADPQEAPRLPTGVRLDPAGPRTDVGNFPLAAVLSPDSTHIVLLLNGWRQQGVQVVERRTGVVTQTIDQPAAFIGLTFAPDGRTLYASGGNTDVIYRYDWSASRLTLRDSLIVRARAKVKDAGKSYPAGIALSADGKTMYVAENLADSLAVIDVASGVVTQRLPAGRYPYAVIVAKSSSGGEQQIFVSSWGTSNVHRFLRNSEGQVRVGERIEVARHPSTMIRSADSTLLFVASGSTDKISVVNVNNGGVVGTLADPTPANLGQGSTPIAMALSRDHQKLYVAEADNNAIAVFQLYDPSEASAEGRPASSGDRKVRGPSAVATPSDTGTGVAGRLLGRAPVGWYPAAMVMTSDSLYVIDAKGRGTAPNPGLPQPGATDDRGTRATSYTAGQINGTITRLALSSFAEPSLSALTARVARANNWDTPSVRTGMPPITHVIYVIKENRTYDQIFADMPQGDGDTSLLFFPRTVTPNHHALAERFGLYDRFFVNAEVSADGHNWSMAAYTTDYTQKTVPSNYSGRGRTYDWEGTNRGRIPHEDGDDDVAEPANGYLWDLAKRKGITFRNYGEFVVPEGVRGEAPRGYKGNKPFLAANTNTAFPGYDLDIQDQVRADVWLRDLASFSAKGEMPQLQILRLPNDHTSGAAANKPTPQAYMADNDLALGRVIDGLSKTKFWATTAVFVLEDDAQNGPDHVDSHRSVLMVISPWARGGAYHRFVNTTDAIATMEALLGLDALSPYDHYGRPLRDIWRTTPDTRPYSVLTPSVSLADRNPAKGTGAIESRKLDLRYEDVAEEDAFNRILWYAIKGPLTPYPGATRMSSAELLRSW
jgi:YVTN family beta-propeller protein